MSSNTDRPAFSVKTGGKDLSASFEVIEITVQKKLNEIPSAVLLLNDGSFSDQSFKTSESDQVTPGSKIEIKAGYNGKEETIFKGVIVSIRISSSKTGTSGLTVNAFDESFKMTLNRKNKLFLDKKDSDIAKEIIGTYSGLKADIAASSVSYPEMLQYHATDWEFLLARMAANGMLININDGQINIGKEDFTAEPAHTLTYGTDIFEIDAGADASYQIKDATAQSWDYGKQEEVKANSAEPKLNTQGDLKATAQSKVHGQDGPVLNLTGKAIDGELKDWADSQLKQSRMALINGHVKCPGTTAISPAKILELKGLGKHFSGKAFATGVEHHFANMYWETLIRFGDDLKQNNGLSTANKPNEAGQLLPSIKGLHIGVVIKLSDDPDKEDRIQVHLPLIHAENEGAWARVACLDAGENRGSFFRPELKDEVIVGFLDNDPRHLVVLGMLNSSNKPAPVSPKDDKNNIKGFYTRSEMKIFFDDEKKIMTLSTPAGNTILLDEENKTLTCQDQNKNKICLNEDGVQIESCKDLAINAKDNIKISAGAKMDVDTKGNMSHSSKGDIKQTAIGKMNGEAMAINLKANTDCKLDALNFNAAAKAQAVVKGSAGVEVSASGVAVLKGGLVKIN